MRKKHFLMFTALLLVSSLVLAACGKKQEVTKVRVGEVTRSIFYAPEYIALSQGFFKDQGLQVELTTTWGGDKTMTALLSNGIDVALVGSETSIYVYQQGSDDPVINFAQLTQTDGSFLVSRKPIEHFSWDQLKGSTFLGQRKGGMPQMAGEYTLKKHNIDPHKDLKLIQNIDFANIASAFASGTGDFVQLFEPTATVFEQQGKGYVVASFGVESGHLPYTVFMSKQSFIKNNPDTIQKFTNALYRAQQWIQQKTPEQAAAAIQSYFPDTDKKIIVRVIKRYRDQGSYATDPIVDTEEWNHLQDIMTEAGELKSHVAHDTLVDESFAKKAMQNQ